MCNVQILTEGWDLPALECLVIARPTESLGLHWQMIGRVVRPADGKPEPVILDHAGNHMRHGDFCRRVDFTLEPGKRVGGTGEALGLKTCPKCFLMVKLGTMLCPECGTDRTPKAPPPVHRPGDLREFTDRGFSLKERTWNAMEALRLERGEGEGWSENQYRQRMGEWPLLVGRRIINPDDASLEDRQAIWTAFEEFRVRSQFKWGWADHSYKEIFGVWPGTNVRTKTKFQDLATRLKPTASMSRPMRLAGDAPSRAGAAAWKPDPGTVQTPKTEAEALQELIDEDIPF